MNAHWLLMLLVIFVSGQNVSAESNATGDVHAAAFTEPVNVNAVMEIDGWIVPADWFLHEFRSTYFRYAGVTNIRQAVFSPFKNRMILHAKAMEQGIDQDPELIAAIEKRTRAMQAFMDYQLEMVKIDMINEVMIRKLGIKVTPDSLTEAQLADFYNEKIKPRPGAPETISEVPPHIRETLKAQAAQAEMERQLEVRIREWETNMVITVNEMAVESVPMPDTRGSPPPGLP